MRSNITFYLDDTAKKYADKAAFVDEKKSVTFKMLRNGALNIAAELVKKGFFHFILSEYFIKNKTVNYL